MKRIVVCIKRVPDTETKVRVSTDGRSVDVAGANMVISPYDEYAIESALQLKEKNNGQVTAISLGGADCEKALRTALAMGVDDAVLLQTANTTGLEDPLVIAEALSAAIKTLDADVILFGRQAIDSDDAAVSGMVAAMLDLPYISYAVSCAKEGERLHIERDADGGREVVDITLPACVSMNKGLSAPRYASLKGVMGAKSKPLQNRPCALTQSKTTIITIALPPQRPQGRIIGEGKDAVPELIRLLHTQAKVL